MIDINYVNLLYIVYSCAVIDLLLTIVMFRIDKLKNVYDKRREVNALGRVLIGDNPAWWKVVVWYCFVVMIVSFLYMIDERSLLVLFGGYIIVIQIHIYNLYYTAINYNNKAYWFYARCMRRVLK